MVETIRAKDNKTIKRYCRFKTSARARREEGLFVIEGLRLCGDALYSGVDMETLLYTDDCFSQNAKTIQALEGNSRYIYRISNEIALRIADTSSPQGVFCICHGLDKSGLLAKIENNGNYIALEDISDPSNLGTILRTAEALGFDGVILSSGCCDLYAPKVLRGSMGAIFRLRFLFVDSMPAFVKEKVGEGMNAFATVPSPKARSILQVDFSGGGILLIGNEANGLSRETIESASIQVTIPMKGGAESLNAAVAAGILMWQQMKSL